MKTHPPTIGLSLVSIATTWLVASTLASVAPASAQGPEIEISPRSVNFGKVDGSRTRKVKIRNRGDADLQVTQVATCLGTSPEFSASPPTATIQARKHIDLRVTYSPIDEGSDTGCLDISSNDLDEPTLSLTVSGSRKESGQGGGGGGANLSLKPDSLRFGDVEIGTIAELNTQVHNQSGSTIEAVVNNCTDTSAEFDFSPLTAFSVGPGQRATILVTYEPIDPGTDTGCLEVRDAQNSAVLAELDVRGTGVEEIDEEGVDLDIRKFKVKKEAKIGQDQSIRVQLWVHNPGVTNDSRPATVVGIQNTEIVYEHTLDVSDRPGNEGITKTRFPDYVPTEAGDILWEATIADDDTDEDLALAVTRVSDPSSTVTNGLDLDIRRFRVTSDIKLAESKAVRLKLFVINRGTIDEEAPAVLVGFRDGVEVHTETIDVSDSPDNSGATRFDFTPFQPDEPGEILWVVVIDDEDTDVDEALAVTGVRP